jgi:hypothetical protein
MFRKLIKSFCRDSQKRSRKEKQTTEAPPAYSEEEHRISDSQSSNTETLVPQLFWNNAKCREWIAAVLIGKFAADSPSTLKAQAKDFHGNGQTLWSVGQYDWPYKLKGSTDYGRYIYDRLVEIVVSGKVDTKLFVVNQTPAMMDWRVIAARRELARSPNPQQWAKFTALYFSGRVCDTCQFGRPVPFGGMVRNCLVCGESR